MSPLSRLLARTQPPLSRSRIAAAALAGALTIAVLGLLSDSTGFPILVAAFGSSCVLVFTTPAAPLAQPINVVGGHLVAAVCGLLARYALPTEWWSLALAVGAALGAMAALRVTHPPAGGTPIAIMLAQESWAYLLVPILVGAAIVAAGGSLFRALSARAERARARAGATAS
ncbi:HPP family protein [Leucobacter weissii]|uniref:HPP family protein n=1 Tax=Leucobacter weissii TaxID=1983706 RepID=A0A939S9B8_9MICO|nr:HPP family protein [Leucobacter weissii]MBO1902981.1 HPP family protein [Leucobacter weissii]